MFVVDLFIFTTTSYQSVFFMDHSPWIVGLGEFRGTQLSLLLLILWYACCHVRASKKWSNERGGGGGHGVVGGDHFLILCRGSYEEYVLDI